MLNGKCAHASANATLPALGDGLGTLARTRKQARATYRQRTFDRQPLRDDVDRALATIFESVREERVAAAKLSSSLPTPWSP